jgi:hypothetical protein
MNAIYIDTTNSDEHRRDLLYSGQLIVHSPTSSSLALVEFARQMLSDAYGRFTEGFNTPDLKAAKALLHELHSGGSLIR